MEAHQMKGDRKGTPSLHVTRNWGLTFLIDTEEHKMAIWILKITLDGEHTMRMLHPSHAGDFIRTKITDPTGLSVTAAAKVFGVSRLTLSSLLNCKADLSGDRGYESKKLLESK